MIKPPSLIFSDNDTCIKILAFGPEINPSPAKSALT